jgi:cell division inhibitor SepF
MGVIASVFDYLGFGGEKEASTSPASTATASSSSVSRIARVTPIRRRSASDISEIHTIDPDGFHDAPEIAAVYREGIPVIINMAKLSEADAKNLLNFMLGLQHGLQGHMKRITPKVFLLTPQSVDVNDEDDAIGESDDVVKP